MTTTVGVIGTGTMGRGIALAMAKAGHVVQLFDTDHASIAEAQRWFRVRLYRMREKGDLTAEGVFEVQNRLTVASALNVMADATLIIETVTEDMDTKLSVLGQCANICKDHTILATNTSSISIAALATATKRADRFAGLHFFYPAEVNRLVELVPGPATSERSIGMLKEIASGLGKTVVVVKDSPGFIVNRIMVPLLNESARLAGERRVPPAAIDDMAVRELGMPMGPFAIMNATGIGTAYRSAANLARMGPFYAPCPTLRKRYDTGRSWPIAGLESGTPKAPTFAAEALRSVAFTMTLALVDEDVVSPADIDLAVTTGLKWHRGPVAWLRETGEQRARDIISQFVAERDGQGLKMPGDVAWSRTFVGKAGDR